GGLFNNVEAFAVVVHHQVDEPGPGAGNLKSFGAGADSSLGVGKDIVTKGPRQSTIGNLEITVDGVGSIDIDDSRDSAFDNGGCAGGKGSSTGTIPTTGDVEGVGRGFGSQEHIFYPGR